MTTPIAAPLLDPWVRPTGDASFTLAAVRAAAPRMRVRVRAEDRPAEPARCLHAARGRGGDRRVADRRRGRRLAPADRLAGADGAGRRPEQRRLCARHGEPGVAAHPLCRPARSRCAGTTATKTTEIATGDGRPILDGDPVAAVVLLANLAALAPRGLCAGDVVTTGSCTGAVAIPGSRRVRGRLRHARQRAPARQLIRTKPAAKRRAFST